MVNQIVIGTRPIKFTTIVFLPEVPQPDLLIVAIANILAGNRLDIYSTE